MKNIYLKYLFLILFMITLSPLHCGKQEVTTSDETKFPESYLIKYESWQMGITIENGKLTQTKNEYTYDNMASATPSGNTVYTASGELTDVQEKELISLIQTNGFLALEAEYGAIPEDRYYPYSISVKLDNVTKDVLFRSNPSAPGAPEAFSEIENYLLKLSALFTDWKKA